MDSSATGKKTLIYGYRCAKCEHEWVPRFKEKEPRVCPACHSPWWDVPKVEVVVKDLKFIPEGEF